MAQQEWDEWGLSSGLPLAGGVEVEVKAFEFGFNNDIAVGTVFAHFTFEADGDEVEQFFSVGKGWTFNKDGTELISEDGKPKKLSKQSNYGLLVASALDCVGGDPTKLGRGFRFADTWVGTRWRTDTVERDVTNVETGEKSKRDRVIFVERLGGAAAPAGKPAAAPAKDESDPLIDELIAMAKDAESHEAFMDKALEEPRFADKAIQKRILSSTKADSIWKLAGR